MNDSHRQRIARKVCLVERLNGNIVRILAKKVYNDVNECWRENKEKMMMRRLIIERMYIKNISGANLHLFIFFSSYSRRKRCTFLSSSLFDFLFS